MRACCQPDQAKDFKLMNLQDSVAVVTGSNRGLGREFAAQLLERGAKKVYATARIPESVQIPGVTPLRLDITDADSVARAAAIASDATLIVNNAGISTGTSLMDGDLARIELEIDTNFYGPLNVTRAFAPILAANGGGAILNVLSVLSWLHLPSTGAYSAAKAAAWAMTDVARQELAPSGIHVAALHVAYMDTDMAAHITARKADPAAVASLALDGIENELTEILADETTRNVKQGLSAPSTPPAAVAA
jgi:NAD(P)-dependent dehydrogenase (short-subunit alcohol dehydrogenase family)